MPNDRVLASALVLAVLLIAAFVVAGDGIGGSDAASGTEYVDEYGETQTVDSETVKVVDGSTTSWTEGWYLVFGEVTITGQVTVTGDVSLILGDGGSLTVSGSIIVNDGNSLTIYGQEAGTGELDVTATDRYCAGIGSSTGVYGGDITINGGIVIATGDDYGAGIGCAGGGFSYNVSAGNITINGGTVTATGGSAGAGIGGGEHSHGGTITINGGTVTANGGNMGAGIGGGYGGSGGTITINGGTVTANGGDAGASIGTGHLCLEGNTTITINGGDVTADGRDLCIGIGGYAIDNATISITINGGDVTAICTYSYAAIGGGDITINGGRVTAIGNDSCEPIGGSYYDDGDAFTTGDNGSAVIIASGGPSAIWDISDQKNWNCILIYRDEGNLYGDVTLKDDLTIESGVKLTTYEGTKLTIPEGLSLTVEGACFHHGALVNNGNLLMMSGSLVYCFPESSFGGEGHIWFHRGLDYNSLNLGDIGAQTIHVEPESISVTVTDSTYDQGVSIGLSVTLPEYFESYGYGDIFSDKSVPGIIVLKSGVNIVQFVLSGSGSWNSNVFTYEGTLTGVSGPLDAGNYELLLSLPSAGDTTSGINLFGGETDSDGFTVTPAKLSGELEISGDLTIGSTLTATYDADRTPVKIDWYSYSEAEGYRYITAGETCTLRFEYSGHRIVAVASPVDDNHTGWVAAVAGGDWTDSGEGTFYPSSGKEPTDGGTVQSNPPVVDISVANGLTYTGGALNLISSMSVTDSNTHATISDYEASFEVYLDGKLFETFGSWGDVKATAAGSYEIRYTVDAENHATATGTVGVTIGRAVIVDGDVSVDGSDHVYSGEAVEPEISVSVGGAGLTENDDYTVSYRDNIGAGTATVTVSGIGNYTGTVEKEFEILPAPLQGSVTVSVTGGGLMVGGVLSAVYDSSEDLPGVTYETYWVGYDPDTGDIVFVRAGWDAYALTADDLGLVIVAVAAGYWNHTGWAAATTDSSWSGTDGFDPDSPVIGEVVGDPVAEGELTVEFQVSANLTYDGSSQILADVETVTVTDQAGNAVDCDLLWAVVGSGQTVPSDGDFAADAPSATDAGEYRVFVRASADGYAAAEASEAVSIAPAVLGGTLTIEGDLEVGGTLTATYAGDDASIRYAWYGYDPESGVYRLLSDSDEGSYVLALEDLSLDVVAVAYATDGNHTGWLAAECGSDWTQSGDGGFDPEDPGFDGAPDDEPVDEGTIMMFATPGIGLVYDGTAQVILTIEVESPTDCIISMTADGAVQDGGVLRATEAGTYYIDYVVYHEGYTTQSGSFEVIIAPAPITGTVTIAGAVSTGSTLTAVYVGEGDAGDPDLSYTWYRYDSDGTCELVQSGPSRTYALGVSDVGCTIAVVAHAEGGNHTGWIAAVAGGDWSVSGDGEFDLGAGLPEAPTDGDDVDMSGVILPPEDDDVPVPFPVPDQGTGDDGDDGTDAAAVAVAVVVALMLVVLAAILCRRR